MREEYLDAIAELEEALSPFHLESDGEWTNYEFNTSTIRVAIESLEKNMKIDEMSLNDQLHRAVLNLLFEDIIDSDLANKLHMKIYRKVRK